jgi:predicted short-subunit dehydrogenase-like oxidoreductase (DUF2520 family)
MSDRRAIGIVGAGHAGAALALALARVGRPARALSSRDAGRRAALADALTGTLIVTAPAEVAGHADLLLLAVPDDVVTTVAATLDPRPGSVVAHLSGVHPGEVLRPFVAADVAVGAFHPLVAFADPERAVDALRGSFVAIDGDEAAIEALRELAEAIAARPVVLAGAAGADAATTKALHHAAAVLAAGGVVALLDIIVELARGAGVDETDALAMYGSLVRQGLANASTLGVREALTGPVRRGDAGTLRAHLAAIGAVAPDALEVYLATSRRQLAMADRGGVLEPDRRAAVGSVLER